MMELLGFLSIGGIVAIICCSYSLVNHIKNRQAKPIEESNPHKVTVRIAGGYSPKTIIAKSGSPIQLELCREDKAPFAETVIFPELHQMVILSYGQKVNVELLPLQTGTYTFTSQFGVYQGKIIVID